MPKLTSNNVELVVWIIVFMIALVILVRFGIFISSRKRRLARHRISPFHELSAPIWDSPVGGAATTRFGTTYMSNDSDTSNSDYIDSTEYLI